MAEKIYAAGKLLFRKRKRQKRSIKSEELIVVVAQRVQNTLEAKNKGEFEIGESPMKIHTTLDEKVSW